MKVVMKPVDMVAWFTSQGDLRPVRFRFLQEGEYKTVKVDRVVEEEEQKQAGIRLKVYRCQSVIKETEKVYELAYEVNTCKWHLYKI